MFRSTLSNTSRSHRTDGASQTAGVISVADFIGGDSPLPKVSQVSTWVKGHGCTLVSVLVAAPGVLGRG